MSTCASDSLIFRYIFAIDIYLTVLCSRCRIAMKLVMKTSCEVESYFFCLHLSNIFFFFLWGEGGGMGGGGRGGIAGNLFSKSFFGLKSA